MNDHFKPRIAAAANDRLDAWDDEGGAPGAVTTDGAISETTSETERRLLERLGAAVLGEWQELPMRLRRAIYERAVDSELVCGPSKLKRAMARFLHDHRDCDRVHAP
jgi:hypothetical protein